MLCPDVLDTALLEAPAMILARQHSWISVQSQSNEILTAGKSDARTRAHSESFYKIANALSVISHEALLQCDASSHRFHLSEHEMCSDASTTISRPV